MNIKVLIDEDGKVIGASTDLADEGIEVDEPEGFMEDPFHWIFVGGELVKDTDAIEQEKAEAERQSLMWQYKQSLNDSDYKIMKFAESLLEVNSLADFLGLILRTRQELREIVRQRSEWRKQINELEEDEDV